MTKTSLGLAAAVLVLCGVVAGQSAPTAGTPALLANVPDSHGMAVHDLTKDSFQVKVNGQRAKLFEASYSLAPRRIIVLLDMSGSMAGGIESKKWQIVREAVDDLLSDTPPDVHIAMLTFSDQVHDVFDFSQTRDSMAAWLKEGATKHGDSRIHGQTALFDAMVAARNLFGASRPGDTIYVITDGGDNSSRVRATAARNLLLESGIRLFVFLLSDESSFPTEATRQGRDSLKEIARASGGFVFGVSARSSGIDFLPSWDAYEYNDNTRKIIKIYTQALNIQVNGFYTLRFDSPLPSRKARKVSLEVVDTTGRPRKDVAFTYSTILLPAAR